MEEMDGLLAIVCKVLPDQGSREDLICALNVTSFVTDLWNEK
jgi:hypothetical protein